MSKSELTPEKKASGAVEARPHGPLTPTEVQRPFLEDESDFYAFISGIGAGKTVGGIIRSLLNISEWNPGEMGAIIGPSVPSLRAVIVPELYKWGVIDRCEYNMTEGRLTFDNGSVVILESAHNTRKIERLRGFNLAWFWMDEAAVIDEAAWDVLVGRLRTGNYQNGFITTTPKGMHNWVYSWFVDTDNPMVEAVTGVTTQDNPHTPERYREHIVEQYEDQHYLQEVKGEFVKFEGLVYTWFDRDTHIIEDAAVPSDYDEVIYGVDWGHNNPSTCLALVRDGDCWYAVENFYERRITVNDHSRAIQGFQDRWGPGPVYCDPSEPANIETFRRDGIDARAAENEVTPGIQHVSSFADNFHVARSCQELRNEFAQYQYADDDQSNRLLKQNDHLMDGLRYALFTHTHRPRGNSDTPFARSF